MLHLAAAVLALIAVLYIPGFIGFYSLSGQLVFSIVSAPLLSTVLVTLIGVVFRFAGFPATAITVLPVLVAVCVVIAFISVRQRERRLRHTGSWLSNDNPAPRYRVLKQYRNSSILTAAASTPRIWVAVLYVAVGLCGAYVVFVSNLMSPDSFIWMWDNDTHTSLVRSFVDSGSLSTLYTSAYLTPEDIRISPLGQPGYYPAVWHMLCALAVEMTGCSVTVAMNASIVAFFGVVYPLSTMMLLAMLLPNDRIVLVCGAFVLPFFAGFWSPLYLEGPLFPFMAGLCVVPLALAETLVALRRFCTGECRCSLVLVLLSMAALGMLHPGALFAYLLVADMYLLSASSDKGEIRFGETWVPFRLVVLVLATGITITWLSFTQLPAFSSTVTYYWKPDASFFDAFVQAFTFSFASHSSSTLSPQYVLSSLVCIGSVVSIIKHKGSSALIAFLAAALFYVVCVSTDSVFRQLLVGYWYNDAMRLAAIECECAVPLAALGLGAVARLFGLPFSNLSSRSRVPLQFSMCFIVCVLAVFLLVTPANTYGMSMIHDLQVSFSGAYGDWNRYLIFSKPEVSQMRNIVGDSLVANDPYDGSCYAYGVDDIRVYYRTNDAVDDESDNDSRMIRTALNELASNDNVKKAVENTGIEYVLQLDPSDAIQLQAAEYVPTDWTGIDSINETTDGFQLVAQSDSFRLYRIVGTD